MTHTPFSAWRSQFFSWQGEMGRDDFLKSSIFRALLFLPVAYFGTKFIDQFDVEEYSLQWSLMVHWWNLPWQILLHWPIIVRRARDLNGKLSVYWVAFFFLTTCFPPRSSIDNPTLGGLFFSAFLIALYPALMLIFSPGKKFDAYRYSQLKKSVQ